MKKIIALVMALSIFLVAGCGGNSAASSSAASAPESPSVAPSSSAAAPASSGTDIKMWRIGTASMTGNFYTMGSAIAQMITNKIDGVEGAAQATGGSADNCFLLQDKEIDLALSQSATVKEAVDSKNAFEGVKIETMRGVGVMYIMQFHVVVNNKSGIKTISDIAGKKVAVAQMGGGVEVNANILLNEFGVIDYTPIYGTMGEAIEAVKTGEADALIYATSVGAANITDALNSGNCSLIGMTEEEVKAITAKRSEFGYALIPAGTYQGQNSDIHTFAGSALILTRDDISEDSVYKFTKAFYENNDYLVSQNAIFNGSIPENAMIGMCVPLHPGAEKYLKEVGAIK
ncbi:MAG: transporter solute receptor, family [Oscillospiraceae bacterium]|nr:transporter solute receptor, family [Oscillospiraceae bacterium]